MHHTDKRPAFLLACKGLYRWNTHMFHKHLQDTQQTISMTVTRWEIFVEEGCNLTPMFRALNRALYRLRKEICVCGKEEQAW